MKKNRVWCVSVSASIFLMLALVALFICTEDPLFQYHAPNEHNTYYSFKSEAYQNPGMIKNCEYDTLTTGSSMTENHDEEYINLKFGAKTLKASFSGANSKNATAAIRLAVQSNPGLKRVLCSLDDHMFRGGALEEGNQSPRFLMDQSILTDVKYWFNQDVLYDYALENRYYERQGIKSNLDYRSTCWYGFPYGEQKVMSFINSDMYQATELLANYYEENIVDNLEMYWIPLIESTPWIEYDLYFPPYSIMYWYNTQKGGSLDATIYIFDQVAKTLLKYDNVRLFCFLDAYDIITNLWNYKDLTHYHFRINDWMIDCMSSEKSKYQMTLTDADSRLEKLREYVQSYPYDMILNNPLRLSDSAAVYFEYMNHDRYLCFGQIKGEYVPESVQTMLISLNQSACPLQEVEGKPGLYWIFGRSKTVQSDFIDSHSVLPVEIEQNGELNQWLEIDGIPYGNNLDGFNLVIYDCENNRVADVVTYSLDSLWHADRMNAWADYPWLRHQWQGKNKE